MRSLNFDVAGSKGVQIFKPLVVYNCVTDFVHTEHRAQRTEEFSDLAAWRCARRFACRPNHDGIQNLCQEIKELSCEAANFYF